MDYHNSNVGWHVYVVAEEGGAFCKIGTARYPLYRLADLQNGNPRRLTFVRRWQLPTRSAALKVEQRALQVLGGGRLKARDWVSCAASEAVNAVEMTIELQGHQILEVAA